MKFIFAALLSVCAAMGSASEAPRPNIILFIADDVSWDDFGCYGNKAARTPHIDRLAAQGRRFDEAFLTASSCSPSRSSIVTGRYPHNLGPASELHAPIAAHLPWFPRLLREAGYYTALVGKHHMTSCPPTPGTPPQPAPFDWVDGAVDRQNNGGHATWVKTLRERPQDKPFFFWFASRDAHRAWDADKEWREDVYGPMHDPQSVVVPPFLVDNPETRQDLASYHNEVTRFDYFIGQVVQELQKQNIFEDTLLLVMADNGRAFPRAKTRLHDSGMKTPFIVHWPAGLRQPGIPTRSLVSAIDIAPTFLGVAGVSVPPEMQGVSFLPVLTSPAARVRQCVFSEHNWHDHEAHGRAVRADGFLYIRNQRPQFPWQGPNDSVHSPAFLSLIAARDAGKLTPHQADVLLAPRPTEELYQTITDPDQINNLASNPEYTAVKAKLARLLNEWTEATGDSCPAKLSPDMYPRDPTRPFEKPSKKDFRGDWPGFDRGADRINAPGPR